MLQLEEHVLFVCKGVNNEQNRIFAWSLCHRQAGGQYHGISDIFVSCLYLRWVCAY